jgi:AraC-like DNA-binding protein
MNDHTPTDIVYAEFAPPPALRAYVRCFWRLRCATPLSEVPPAEPILPDGCVEVVLHLGEPFSRRDNDALVRQPKQLLAGQITTAIVLQPSTTMDVWGIRLHPWAAGAFLGLPSVELRDRVLSLDELSASLARALSGVADEEGDDAQLAFLVRVLSTHVASVAQPEARMRHVVAHVVARNDDYSVRRLAKELGLGTRRVDAMFSDHVGLSPKQLLRIFRFQRALAMRRTMPSVPWASIALRAGYYDQAHLVRDARAIAGATPTELLLSSGGLTEIFLATDSGGAD